MAGTTLGCRAKTQSKMEDAGVPHQSDILEETSEKQLAYAIHDEYSDTANAIRKRKERERERERCLTGRSSTWWYSFVHV